VHLERTDTNERMHVLELQGVAATDLRGALKELEAVASACPSCKRPFYHASINTRADERMTPEQREQAIDRLEKELGLTRISQRTRCIGAKNQRKLFCDKLLSRFESRPDANGL
jgi:DNA repair exonuclease SbcCD ATPase subunit